MAFTIHEEQHIRQAIEQILTGAIPVGTPHAHIANIADAASGAQIATAVNAIIATLEAFGLAASS